MRTALYTICVFLFIIVSILLHPEGFNTQLDRTLFEIFGLIFLTSTSYSLFSDWRKKR